MQQNAVILLQLKDRRSSEIWGKKKNSGSESKAVCVCVCEGEGKE